MSSINGLGGAAPLQQTQNITNNKAVDATHEARKPVSDRLELSGMSHLLQTLKSGDVRTDKVAAIKAQIADGTYDADGSKLDSAVDKLVDEIS